MFPHPIGIGYFINYTQALHTTIDDILKLKKGDRVKFLCLDRNFYDLIDTNPKKNFVPRDIKEVCKENYMIDYIHEEGTRGKMKLIDIDSGTKEVYEPFEWDFEYFHDRYFPLTNGHITPIPIPNYKTGQIVQYESFNGILKPDDPRAKEKIPWQKFKNTSKRVGWRGPVIPLDLLQYCPKVYTVDWDTEDKIEDTLSKISEDYFKSL